MSDVFFVHEGRAVTYARFAGMVRERARELGTLSGASVGLWADHGPDFLINLFALWQSDAVPLLLSRRLPWTTVSTLLETARASQLIHGDVGPLPEAEGTSITLRSARCVHDVADDLDLALPAIGSRTQATAFILHTSGTTGVPKLVSVSRDNVEASLAFLAERWGERWTSRDASLGFLPLFHSYGLISELLSAYRKRSRYYFAGGNPYQQLEQLRAHGSELTLLFTVPWLLRQMLELPGALEALAALRFVMVGGALIGRDLGERLRAGGVRLVQNYGMTELGPMLMGSVSDASADDRDLFPVVPERHFHLDADRQLVVHADCPALCVRSDNGFATHDVFSRSESGAYRYESRLDDVLVHENGEKSNALAIEAALLDHVPEKIELLAVLGQARLRTACVVQWRDEPTLPELERLTRALDAVNGPLPSYSQLHRDLILHLGPSFGVRRLPVTAKGTVSRARAEAELHDELATLYARCGQSDGTTLISFFPRPEQIDASRPLFEQGMDSVQAVAFRNHIARLYAQRAVPANVVYQYPSLDRLERFLAGELDVAVEPPTFKPLSAAELAALPSTVTRPRRLLLTGASGFVGTQLLTALARSPEIEHVHCLVREAPSADARRFDKVTYHANYAFADASLGLSADVYTELAETVDTVVHGAWPVSFNFTYAQLGAEALPSLEHLIAFAKRGRASLHFLSTVGTIMLHGAERVGEELPASSARTCFPHGYAQTKWHGEQLLLRSGVPHKIFRLGQFSAHTQTGFWKEADYVPVLMRAAKSVGSVPLLPLPIDWIPVDVGCTALIELMNQPEGNIHHIANPCARPAAALAGNATCLPLPEWLKRVEPHLAQLPRIAALWPFLEQMSRHERLSTLDVTASARLSPTLAACEPISDAYLSRVFG